MELYDKLVSEYSNRHDFSEINEKRIAQRLSRLASIGMTSEGGSNRVAYSKEDREAKELLKSWMAEAGLEVYEDAIGNVIGRLLGSESSLPVVLVGSHIDTVPNGGHFDGTLGVICALEVAQIWKEQGFIPKRGLEVVAFADEEGARFHGGLTGSRVMLGEMSAESLQRKQDGQGMSFSEVLQAHGLEIDRLDQAVRHAKEIHAYVELHIEQGKVLERNDLPVGIVTGIAGPVWLEIEWSGEADHAGNTPMGQRRDALAAASEFNVRVEQLPTLYSDTAVATVGKMTVSPGGINVIPGQVKLVVDIRDIYRESRDQLAEAIKKEAGEIAERRGLAVCVEEKVKVDPVLIHDDMKNIVKTALDQSGLPAFYLPSGAGHDAMIMGRHLPTAMIFVRCKDGISHNPKEWTSLDDIVLGCRVLKDTLYQLVM
jgi:allantoate deiminase